MKTKLEQLRIDLRKAYRKYNETHNKAHLLLISRYASIEKKLVKEELKAMKVKHD